MPSDDDVGAELGVDDRAEHGQHVVAARRRRAQRASVARSCAFYRSGPCNLASGYLAGVIVRISAVDAPRHPTSVGRRVAPRRPEGARRQHPLRDLPRAGPGRPAAGHRRDRRDARAAPQHGAPPPRADARGRPARGRRPRRAARSAGPSTATRSPPSAPSLGLEPPTMPVLARMVLRMAERLGASAGRRRSASGETKGRPRAAALRRRAVGARGAGRRPRPARLRPRSSPTATTADHAPSSPSPTARSPTSPPTHPTSCAGCTVAWSRASSTRWATPRSSSSARSSHRTPCQVEIAARVHLTPSIRLSYRSTNRSARRTHVITLTDTAAVKVKELLAGRGRRRSRPARRRAPRRLQRLLLRDVLRRRRRRRRRAGRRSATPCKVVVDPASAQLLEGATLDYKDGLDQSGFAITNPNATRTCGCGQSFS